MITIRSYFLGFMFMLFLGACEKNACKKTICLNGSTCLEGACSCLEGYEGDECGEEIRAKLFGIYEVRESCNGFENAAYFVEIKSASQGVLAITFANLANIISQGATEEDLVYAFYDPENDFLQIPQQSIAGAEFVGSGSITDRGMKLEYTFFSSYVSDCTANLIKQ